jgi:putative hydrolase of the HAD superfamily
MIIFDYGQTLINELSFDVRKGTEAVLKNAANNPHNVSIEDVYALSKELFEEIGKYRTQFPLEVHNHIFQKSLYDYLNIELTKSPEEVERIFVNAATIAESTKGIEMFLQSIDMMGIRSSVISNISFSGKLLTEKINLYIPANHFEFIIASSEYIFRKPHRRIFELALSKAGLESHEVWYCGDNAMFDVDGAANCGIFPVWYKGALDKSNTFIPNVNCLEVSNWSELLEFLNKS